MAKSCKLNSTNIFLVITVLCLWCCSGETGQIGSNKTPDLRDSSTIEMAAELQRWNATLTPEKSKYKSLERSRMFKENSKTASGIDKLTFELRSEYELLLAGESMRAYHGFHRIDSIARAMGIPANQPVYRMTQEFRAVAMLRLGEQENCIHNHSIESCIMPFGEDSYHQLTKGSEGAIKEIESLLAQKEDLNFRYILNVAYMTLGRYPEDVPNMLSLLTNRQGDSTRNKVAEDLNDGIMVTSFVQ